MATRLNLRRQAAPQVTTPMIALAWSVLNCPDQNREDARLLAKLILEAAGGKT